MRAHFGWVFLLLLTPLSGVAGTYKWVDERGVTHYGDAIPPAYVNRGATELSKKGLVLKQTAAALTPEQRQSRQAEIDFKNGQLQQAREQRRRDNALLNTYTSAAEIDLQRDRNLQQLELLNEGARTRSRVVLLRLKGFRTEAAQLKSDKKPVPANLKADITRSQEELDRIEAGLTRNLKDIEAIKAKFSADRMRYQELTQVAVKSG